MTIDVAGILLKGTLTLSMALAASWAMRERPASLRHFILTLGFASLLVIPVAGALAPSIAVSVPAVASIADVPVESVAPNAAPRGTWAAADIAGTVGRAAAPRSRVRQIVAVAWLAGAACFLLPLLIGAWQVRQLRRAARPWQRGSALLASVARDLGIRRPVQLLLDDAGPATFGVVRHTVLLPLDVRGWEGVDVRRALIHELEHVRRGDCLLHVTARAICALYWFHPLVWIAWRRLRLEAECACDDGVVRRHDAPAYAEQLVALAECGARRARRPVLAMASRNQLAARVRSILATGRPRGHIGRRSAIAHAIGACATLAAIAPLHAVRPDATARVAAPMVQRQIAPDRFALQPPASPVPPTSVATVPTVSSRPPLQTAAPAAPQPPATMDPERQERQLEEALGSDRAWTDLPLSISASFSQLNRAEYAVAISLRIGPAPELAVGRTRLDVIGVVTDAYGVSIQRLRDKIELKVDADSVAALAARPIEYESRFIMLPGRYTVKVLVRDQTTGHTGVSTLPFTIPNLAKEQQAQ